MKKDSITTRRRLVPPERSLQMVLALLAALAAIVWWQAWRSLQSELAVVFVDVGQGDCIIVSSPTGRNILIDAGSRARRSDPTVNVARWTVLPALYRQGVRKIDCIIATHPHDDHIGGLAEVIDQVPVDMILDAGHDYSSPAYREFLAAAKTNNIPVIPARRGQRFNLGVGITAQVLHPAAPLLEGTEEDANNNSIVLRLQYDDISFLFTGDLQTEGEVALLARRETLASTVLKIGHHGSMDASSPAFLRAVNPRWAVISVSRRNSFAHPHQQMLDRFKPFPATIIFRTDDMGTIEMVTDGRALFADYGRFEQNRATLEGVPAHAAEGVN